MLHQKLFFKDLLDHSSGKLELSETLETRMMPRLSKMINHDDQTGRILINALLKLNDQLNPSISGEIEADLILTCQRCLGHIEWSQKIEYSINFINGSEAQEIRDNVDYISINDEGITLLDILEDEVLTSIPMSIMHKNIELCENIDKLSMFLRSSDKKSVKKNKPFSDLSEIMGKDDN
ncbi:DUF177 domain-containing protein [Gammaproteobacteria bacterium]|nr:DUF177 domain-containing protein [Gammaproteobacteria bacterium]